MNLVSNKVAALIVVQLLITVLVFVAVHSRSWIEKPSGAYGILKSCNYVSKFDFSHAICSYTI